MTIHLFILQSLVSAALYTTVKRGGGPENQRISYSDLHAQVFFLSQLFRGEFIFPTEGLDHNLAQTINGLEADDVIKVTRDEHGNVTFIELSDAERASGRENFDFYCFLIWPFIEASWLGAISLTMLAPPTTITTTKPAWLDLKSVQDRAQLFGKTLYHQGDLSYFEAVNKETLKNAYTRFQDEGIILVTKTSPARIRLKEEWVPERDGRGIVARGRLWEFAERISWSRREGKNRRDGATVQSRVLKLADKVARELWAGAVVEDGNGDADGDEKSGKAKGKGARARL